jgi:catechol 2,3-dioxygenase-like lactoylglutathione lyase family enzyme
MSSQISLVVKDLAEAVLFYQKAFGFGLVKQSARSAVLRYQDMRFHFCTDDYMQGRHDYSAESPVVSGMSPPIVFSLFHEQVHEQLHRAIGAGARVVQSLRQDEDGHYQVLLQGPERYFWLITDRT